nr:MAG TPA: hypothetical protein [Siphoviridae sp. ctRJB2]
MERHSSFLVFVFSYVTCIVCLTGSTNAPFVFMELF